MINFKLILCPVDFSATSTHALETAIELATELNAKIHLVHVYQYPAFSLPEADLATPIDLSIQEGYVERLGTQLAKLKDKYTSPALSISTTLAEGVPYVEIIHTAKEVNADLIIVGTHGRTGLSHMLLGSVAERVVRSATIPVLSVPDNN